MFDCDLFVATDKLPKYEDRLNELRKYGLLVTVTQTGENVSRISIRQQFWDYS